MVISFETERLSARPPVLKDAEAIHRLFQDKDIAWNLARAPWPYALEDAQWWIGNTAKTRAKGTEYAVVLEHAEHGLIGSVGMLQVQDNIWEIGYWIGKPFWGQGFVSEAARGLLDWAERELGVTQFVSGHVDDNPASGRVLEKLGFCRIGEQSMYTKGRDCEVNAVRYVYGGAPKEIALKPFHH